MPDEYVELNSAAYKADVAKGNVKRFIDEKKENFKANASNIKDKVQVTKGKTDIVKERVQHFGTGVKKVGGGIASGFNAFMGGVDKLARAVPAPKEMNKRSKKPYSSTMPNLSSFNMDFSGTNPVKKGKGKKANNPMDFKLKMPKYKF